MSYGAIDIPISTRFRRLCSIPRPVRWSRSGFRADRESLARWAEQWRGQAVAVEIEATTGWRWVWRGLFANGFEVRLAEPVQPRALLDRRHSAKTDRFDALWLPRLPAVAATEIATATCRSHRP